MANKDIFYNPDVQETHRELKKFLKNYQKTGESFIRWINGTCRTPETRDEELQNYICEKYSYVTEIEFSKEIKTYGNSIMQIIKKDFFKII